jgi:periplasmic copper chaperone A
LKKATIGALVLVLFLLNSPALAHVTIQPNEAVLGSFSRFVVRVPNEEADANTTSVEVELPPMAFVSFEPKEGWKRTVEMTTLDEPIEAFGGEIDEVVGTVSWSGGSIGPGEFDEFGFSAKMPDEESTLEFLATQTYDSGKVVEWVGAADSEEPAPLLHVLDIGAGEEEGPLAVLARVASGGTESDEGQESDDSDSNTVPLALAAAAFVVALLALAASLRSKGASGSRSGP